MEVVRLESLVPLGWPSPAVSVGNFDGVHLGHQTLVAVAVADARVSGGTAAVLTFDPHPSRILSPDRAPEALMTVDQKAEVLGGLGVDRLVVLPFTRELSHETPDEFARLVLQGAFGARVVVVGSTFRFGRGRAGDVALLARLGEAMGFRVHGLDPVMHEGTPISSSRIREALARGAVEAASRLLGRRFFVDGTVVRGAGRGRTLGFPTANVAPMNEMLPGAGVYAAWCRRLDDPGRVPQAAVVNVGRRPTFGGGAMTLEAHLLDVQGDLYGRALRVEFQERLREERAFPGAEALAEQIERDVARAREVLEKA
jgi:riboflavin kinase/FMN adenylyltransferase